MSYQTKSFPADVYLATSTQASTNDHLPLLSVTTALLLCLASVVIYSWNIHIKRLGWNVIVQLTPSSFLYAMEYSLRRRHQNGEANASFRRADFGNIQAKSDALRRLIGLDSNGPRSPAQSIRYTSIPAGGNQLHNLMPAGLGNWDNSCYQNSIVQALAALPSFRVFLAENLETLSISPGASTHEALSQMIDCLHNFGNGGRRLWIPSTLKPMNSWQQQDAQEYFSKLIDEIDAEITRYEKGQRSGLSLPPQATKQQRSQLRKLNPFQGSLAQRVGCTKCKHTEGFALSPFTCLTLNLNTQYEYDIRDCLDEYTALESIEGVECVKCTLLQAKTSLEKILDKTKTAHSLSPQASDQTLAIEPLRTTIIDRLNVIEQVFQADDFSDPSVSKKCAISARKRVSSTKSKQVVVARAPQILVLHINRSIFDPNGLQRKNNAQVRFPLTLDLSQWCLGSKYRAAGDGFLEAWTEDPVESMLSAAETVPSFAPNIFQLRAVITHYGGHENGHYIAYRRRQTGSSRAKHIIPKTDEPEDSWFRFSDAVVSPVSEQEVLRQGGVFMLFYETMGSTPHTDFLEDRAPSDDKLSAVVDQSLLHTADEEDILEEPFPSTSMKPSCTYACEPANEVLSSTQESKLASEPSGPVAASGSSDKPDNSSRLTSGSPTEKIAAVAPAMRTAGSVAPDSRGTRRPSNISMHSPSFVAAS